jgi:hypothetical protein
MDGHIHHMRPSTELRSAIRVWCNLRAPLEFTGEIAPFLSLPGK